MNQDKDPGEHERTMVASGGTTRTIPDDMPARAAAFVETDHGDKLSLGTRLGEFEITGLVGEGGFSIVYLAWDHSLERRVALKEYMPSSLAMRTGGTQVVPRSQRHRETFEIGLRSFVNEGKLLAQFDHPALVKVYRFWEAHGTAYMVMPFYEGTTLKDTVRAMNASPDEAWLRSVLGPLTEALMVIHAVQCFHRDIAPDNVMLLSPAGKPLLLDFGAARRVIGDRTQALTVILKPGYAPVEQYAEDIAMKQGAWTDVYALAAVVYWAIIGKTPPVAVGRMLTDSFVPLARCAAGRYSAGFLHAVDRALAVLPEHRTQSVEQFRREMGLDRDDRGESDKTVAWIDPEATLMRPATVRVAVQAPPAPTAVRPARARVVADNDDAKTVVAAPRAGPSKRRPAIAALLVAVVGSAAVVGWWSSRPPRTVVASSDPAASAAPSAASSAVAQDPAPSASLPTPPPANVEPPAVAARVLTTAAAVEQLFAERDVSIQISASAEAASSALKTRIRFRATEGGHAYVIALPASGDRLRLLHPVSVAKVSKSSNVAQVEVPSVSIEPGARVMLVLSRGRRQLAAAGWASRQGVLSRDLEGMPIATTVADAVLGPLVCSAPPTRCDPGFGMTEVTSMTNVTPPLPVDVDRPDERVGRPPPTPIDGGAAAANRPVAGGTTERKPPTNRDVGRAAECARILQRMSLGEASAELIERMKVLRCS